MVWVFWSSNTGSSVRNGARPNFRPCLSFCTSKFCRYSDNARFFGTWTVNNLFITLVLKQEELRWERREKGPWRWYLFPPFYCRRVPWLKVRDPSEQAAMPSRALSFNGTMPHWKECEIQRLGHPWWRAPWRSYIPVSMTPGQRTISAPLVPNLANSSGSLHFGAESSMRRKPSVSRHIAPPSIFFPETKLLSLIH